MPQAEAKLEYILGTVNDWLKFAEAKNAGLLVFAGAACLGLLSFIGATPHLAAAWRLGLLSAITLLSLSCLICLLSFSPRVNRLRVVRSRKKVPPADKDNLLFFGDLAGYKAKQLLDTLSRRYFGGEEAPEYGKAHQDLANQIIINSRIAVSKYNLFRVALWLAIASIPLVPLVAALHPFLSK